MVEEGRREVRGGHQAHPAGGVRVDHLALLPGAEHARWQEPRAPGRRRADHDDQVVRPPRGQHAVERREPRLVVGEPRHEQRGAVPQPKGALRERPDRPERHVLDDARPVGGDGRLGLLDADHPDVADRSPVPLNGAREQAGDHVPRGVPRAARRCAHALHPPATARLGDQVEPLRVARVCVVRDPRALADVEQHLALEVGADGRAGHAVREVALREVEEERHLRRRLRREEGDERPRANLGRRRRRGPGQTGERAENGTESGDPAHFYTL